MIRTPFDAFDRPRNVQLAMRNKPEHCHAARHVSYDPAGTCRYAVAPQASTRFSVGKFHVAAPVPDVTPYL